MSVPRLNLSQINQKENQSHADAEVALDKFIKNKELPPPNLKSKVFQLLDRLRIEAASKRDYKDAAYYQKITKELQQQSVVSYEMEKMRLTTRKIASSRNSMQSKIGSTYMQYDKEIDSYKKKRKQELEIIEENHKAQIDEFTRKWKDSKHMNEFNKPSPQLLQLKVIEKKQVLIGDYENAEITAKRADALEKEEIKQANERAVRKMKTDYNNLIKKQEAEIEIFNKRTELNIKGLEAQKINQAKPISTCLKYMDQEPRSKSKRVRISPERAQSMLKARKKSEIERDYQDLSLATPRTYQRMMDLRSSNSGGRLNLNGVDVTQHIMRHQRALSSMK